MPTLWLVICLFGFAAIGYFLGRGRALSSAGGDVRALHSLPGYYGLNAAMSALIPALIVLVLWMLVQPVVINQQVSGIIPTDLFADNASRDLAMPKGPFRPCLQRTRAHWTSPLGSEPPPIHKPQIWTA